MFVKKNLTRVCHPSGRPSSQRQPMYERRQTVDRADYEKWQTGNQKREIKDKKN